MMGIRNAGFRITASASFSREHERRDACDVGLKRQYFQVHHQTNVILELFGGAQRPRDSFTKSGRLRVLRFHSLQTKLYLANRVEVLVDSLLVGRAKRS